MEYTSKSQLARVLSESWIAKNGYCLACDSDVILQTTANTQARDFNCPQCAHPYELKSSIKAFGKTIVDGAYASMMRRVNTNSVPSFLLMRYSEESTVADLMAIHHAFITPEIILKRKPLGLSAKRAGWVGCNISLHEIPPEGRITLVRDNVIVGKKGCRELFKASETLFDQSVTNRGWARALLNCLHKLSDRSFTIEQAYTFEAELSRLYPRNQNIRPKIRQQLQVLRDSGLVQFESRGSYRLTHKQLETSGE